MKEFQENMVERMEAVEKKVELVEKVEGPMADRVMEIVQKEIVAMIAYGLLFLLI